MSLRISVAVLFLFSVPVAFASAIHSPAVVQAASAEADLKALNLLRDAAVEALRSADTEALHACFTTDAVVMDPHSSSATRREGQDDRFLDLIFWFGAIEITLTPRETVVSGQWAFEWGSHHAAKLENNAIDSEAQRHHEGDYLAILRRQSDGEWKIARFIYTEPIY